MSFIVQVYLCIVHLKKQDEEQDEEQEQDQEQPVQQEKMQMAMWRRSRTIMEKTVRMDFKMCRSD